MSFKMKRLLYLIPILLLADNLPKPKTRQLSKDELLQFRAINAEVNLAQESLKRLKREAQDLLDSVCLSVGAESGKDCKLDETSVSKIDIKPEPEKK